MKRVHDRVGDPPLRRHAGGFEGLARIVVAQQLSSSSADAIWTRTVALAQPFGAESLLALGDGALRGAGLSRPKIRTLRALASAVAMDQLDLDSLARESTEVQREALTAISGIGPWTADIFDMFCVGRADAWAPGDLALQLSTQAVLGLEAKPSSRELEEIGERWRPWRSIAARLLWAHYKHPKD
jgi:DNA-3-methyladenine glycosylase II